MFPVCSTPAERALGRSPEALSLRDRVALAGKIVALEIYTSKALPLRRIQAIGDSALECIAMLRRRSLDPRRFEFLRLK